MKQNLYERIKKVKLTKKEERLVDMLTKNINTVAFLNGAKMAEECGVSASLITRFIKKLGYEGFAEFKNALEEIYRSNNTPHDRFQQLLSEDNISRDIFNASFAQDIDNLLTMQNSLDRKLIEKVCAKLEAADNVYLAAMFTSEICVHLLSFYLKRLGIRNTAFLGIGLSKQIEYCNVTENDVVVAITSMGYLSEVIEAAEYAKRSGAFTVSITGNDTNPLARNCDINLVAPAQGAAIDYSQVAPIAMVNLITNTIAADRPEEVLEQLAQEKERWAKFYRFGFAPPLHEIPK